MSWMETKPIEVESDKSRLHIKFAEIFLLFLYMKEILVILMSGPVQKNYLDKSPRF